MWKFNELIFDEIIQTGGTGEYYTEDSMNELLGRCDLFALQLLVDDVVTTSATPSLQVWIETSCDGEHWATKSQIAPTSLSTTGLTKLIGAEDGTNPNYALVRVHVQLTCTNPASAHLVMYATGRDSGSRAHALSMSPTMGYKWIRDSLEHKLTDEQKKALFDLCKKKKQLPYKECVKHFGYWLDDVDTSG